MTLLKVNYKANFDMRNLIDKPFRHKDVKLQASTKYDLWHSKYIIFTN